jgi:hypothetical protein
MVPDGENASLSRFCLAMFCLILTCRMIDLYVGYAKSGQPKFKDFALFVVVPFHFVFRKIGAEKGPGRRKNTQLLARGLLEMAIGAAAWALVVDADLGQRPQPTRP